MDPFRLASSLLDATGGVPVKHPTTKDPDMIRKSNRKWPFLSGLLVVLALAVAGCGGGGSSPSSTSSVPAASAPASTSSQSSSSGIPQGPHAGDQDGDNSGGPSDGDGNI
jgi:hypothetical protein